MATEYSFDIVSTVDLTIVQNCLDQAEKEIAGRFDFRGTKTKFTLEDNEVKVISDDEYHLNTVLDIIRGKLAKREISLKAMEYGKIEGASGGTVRQVVTIRQGIPGDAAKNLVKEIKASGIKVQAQMQNDQVRVTAKDKDALQAVQKLVKSLDLTYDAAFTNYR